MMTLVGVLLDIPVSNILAKFEADRPNGLRVIMNCNSLRDQVFELNLSL